MRITFIEHLGWYFEDCVHGGEGPAFSHSLVHIYTLK